MNKLISYQEYKNLLDDTKENNAYKKLKDFKQDYPREYTEYRERLLKEQSRNNRITEF